MIQFFHIVLLSLPLVVGGVLHMIAVKADILSYFKRPIHHRWFGMNKTWRGFIVMPLATFPGVWVAQKLELLIDLNTPLLVNQSTLLLSIVLGCGYCLAELPNSFMKRRLGIKEGQTSEKFKWLFVVVDQADSAFGCMLAYRIFIPIPTSTVILTIIFGTILHLFINVSLYLLKIRKNPF